MNSKARRNGNGKKNIKNTFEELKEKITSQPVLSLPRREEKFRVETDVL